MDGPFPPGSAGHSKPQHAAGGSPLVEPKTGATPAPVSPGSGAVQVSVGDRPDTGAPGSPEWFERVYREAGGDASRVPWEDARPNPSVLTWLNAEAAARVRPGSRAIVVGCGLGDDVVELLNRGYDACGFDVSAAAIDWARKRFPAESHAFVHADLFNLPTRFRHRFELVIEVSTIQALHPSQREVAAQAIGNLCGPRGVVLAVCRGRDEQTLLESVPGPPWPLSPSELCGLMESAGLKPARALDDFEDDRVPPVRVLRGVFERA